MRVMDIEQLSKSQIVLLTLLVSFMTSIATGIVTVSLMQQAPQSITQTVSKVVEHTVEKAVPSQALPAAAAAATPTLPASPASSSVGSIADAVAKADASVVRLYASDDPARFIGIGIAIAPGVVVTDSAALDNAADAYMQISDGKQVHLFVRQRSDDVSLAYLAFGASTTPISLTPATISPSNPVLGQTVVVLSGKSATKIAVGVITAISPISSKDGKDGIQVLETNLQDSDIIYGSPIIDTTGNIIGVSTAAGRASSKTTFLASQALIAPAKAEISNVSAQ